MTFLFLDIFFSTKLWISSLFVDFSWKKFLRVTCPYRWSFVASIQELLLKHPLHQGYDLRFEDVAHWKTMGSRRAWQDFGSWNFLCLREQIWKKKQKCRISDEFPCWQLEMLKRCSEFHSCYGYFPMSPPIPSIGCLRGAKLMKKSGK